MGTYYVGPPDAVTLLHNLASLVAYSLKGKIVVTIEEPDGESTFTSDYRFKSTPAPAEDVRQANIIEIARRAICSVGSFDAKLQDYYERQLSAAMKSGE